MKLFDEVIVLAFCILDNHVHLVLHQFTADGIRKLMSRVLASYARDFNRQMNWRGPVFDGRYSAKRVDATDIDYLKNMIAYVELNDPIQQFDNPFSSHSVLSGQRACSWLDQERTMAIFGGVDGYRNHMNRVGPAIVKRKIERLGLAPEKFPYRPIQSWKR